jgi:hypothetical protein
VSLANSVGCLAIGLSCLPGQQAFASGTGAMVPDAMEIDVTE